MRGVFNPASFPTNKPTFTNCAVRNADRKCKAKTNLVSACGKPNLGEYTAKPHLPIIEDTIHLSPRWGYFFGWTSFLHTYRPVGAENLGIYITQVATFLYT